MALQVKVPVDKPDDLNSIPRTPIVKGKTTLAHCLLTSITCTHSNNK